MDDPLGNPQEIFRSRLPVGALSLVILFRVGIRMVNWSIQEYWVDEVLTTRGTLFRGATAYPRGRGVWRDDARGGDSLLERKEPVIVFSYVAEADLTSQCSRGTLSHAEPYGPREPIKAK